MTRLSAFAVAIALAAANPVGAAIFTGGSSDGFDSRKSGIISLDGRQEPTHKYTGGYGDGYGCASYIFTPISSVGDMWLYYDPRPSHPTSR